MTYLSNLADADKLKPAAPGEPVRLAAEEGVNHILWASQQAIAMSKLQIFSAMAKKVSDQQ